MECTTCHVCLLAQFHYITLILTYKKMYLMQNFSHVVPRFRRMQSRGLPRWMSPVNLHLLIKTHTWHPRKNYKTTVPRIHNKMYGKKTVHQFIMFCLLVSSLTVKRRLADCHKKVDNIKHHLLKTKQYWIRFHRRPANKATDNKRTSWVKKIHCQPQVQQTG